MKPLIIAITLIAVGLVVYSHLAHADTMCYFVDNILICTNS